MTFSKAAAAVSRWGDAYLRYQYAVLFFSLLLSLAISPLLSTMHAEGRTLETFLLLNVLLASTGAEKTSRGCFLTALAIVAGFRLLGQSLDSKGIDEGSAFALAAITLVATVGSLRFAMRTRTVDTEHIYAALSAYLLAGQFFGILAASLEQVVPGSYSGASLNVPGQFPAAQAIYFSFVTLATLGYGDIVPVNAISRGVAIVEAVAGQLYIAVLVARLVGGYTSRDTQ